MPLAPETAAIRFGTGLSPVIAAPEGAAGLMAALEGPDLAAEAHPITLFSQVEPSLGQLRRLNNQVRASGEAPELVALADAARRVARAGVAWNFAAQLSRWATTGDGLRERLVGFWANHFTVRSRIALTHHLVTPFVEEAIRPHVTGRFADMLRAVTTHPMMLNYLDQSQSMGPNSTAAQRNDRGLNENLARELLELHTIGADGPYDQDDVRELAELLTGLAWRGDGTVYLPNQAEPGSETVLGITYSDEASIDVIHTMLDDLARHPATAGHIARKFARHFTRDDPDPALVEALRQSFVDSDGDLLVLTGVLVDHPAAQGAEKAKVRLPFEFLAAAARALDLPVTRLRSSARDTQQIWLNGLTRMGQTWESPQGPDGWSDTGPDWINPQFMAARIDWAMRMVPRLFTGAEPPLVLPDPRDLARTSLGDGLPEEVAWAANAAEEARIGVAVVLSSSAFQRR